MTSYIHIIQGVSVEFIAHTYNMFCDDYLVFATHDHVTYDHAENKLIYTLIVWHNGKKNKV